jgi:hypothetical protein
MNIRLKRTMLVVAGAAGGFAYYYFVGCYSGACPITANPYISTLYGGFIGAVLGLNANKPAEKPKG